LTYANPEYRKVAGIIANIVLESVETADREHQ